MAFNEAFAKLVRSFSKTARTSLSVFPGGIPVMRNVILISRSSRQLVERELAGRERRVGEGVRKKLNFFL